MKFKLIDVKTNTHLAQVGSCEYCFSIQEIDEPVYVVEVDGKNHEIQGYNWAWGHYDQVVIDNVVAFAEYLGNHEFGTDEFVEADELFYWILQDYSMFENAERYEVTD